MCSVKSHMSPLRSLRSNPSAQTQTCVALLMQKWTLGLIFTGESAGKDLWIILISVSKDH